MKYIKKVLDFTKKKKKIIYEIKIIKIIIIKIIIIKIIIIIIF